MTTSSIGELARQTGVHIDTVRYYERNGLLSPVTRSASGYRRYGPVEFQRLRFIRRAKTLKYTLDDIRQLLALSNQHNDAKDKRTAQTKLDDIEQRIAELERIRSG